MNIILERSRPRWPFQRHSTVWLPTFTLCLLAMAAHCPVHAQVAFTRILEGDIASDRGNFLGCAWGDYDNDGYQDLFVGNEGGLTNRLYHNNRNGTFSRITTGTIVSERADTDAPVWGDFDNDGDLDLFCSNYGSPPRDFFYRNEGGGSFTKISQGAWVNDSSAGVGAAWGDYDNDGFLDLYVANAENQNDLLYHNNADGTMTKITTGPVPNSGGISIGCVWTDYDGDGDLDLLVANSYGQNNFQFCNNGNGTFTRITTGPLVASGAGALASADYDNDGDLDFLVTVDSSSKNEGLYRNEGPAGFVSLTTGPLVTSGGDSIGVAWGDYDNDGFLDVFVSNDLGQNNFLFHNEGDGTFSRVTNGSVVNDGGRSWGCAWADYDNDGDLDLFVANGGYGGSTAPPVEAGFLYRNDGGTNKWLLLKLVGTASNRSAIGAKVRVLATIGGRTFWQLRELSGGSSWCSQNDLRAHFGLGDATNVDLVRIEWPSGNVQELVNVATNQIITLTEPTLITPARPSVSLNGSVTLTRSFVSGATYQWRFDGVDLVGQTSRTLSLTNIVAGQEGRYSVVVSNVSTLVTNFVYLHVDTQFTKITQGPIVNDRLNTWYGYWGDYDHDGRLDVLVTGDSGQWRLYHNDGGAMFSTVTNGVMGQYNLRAMYGIWADPDNDDDLDVFAEVYAAGSTKNMFWNDGGGNFTRVPVDGWGGGSCGGAWGDFDQDGFIDAFFGTWELGTNALFHNNGDGTLTKVTNTILNIRNDTVQLSCAVDYDNDGDLDLIPVRWGVQPTRFYRNDGHGTFAEATPEPIRSELTYSLSAAWGDFDNDGDLDVIFGGWDNLKEHFYINNGDGTFTRWAGQPALFELYGSGNGSWVGWGDFDNDGYLDLAVTKGPAPIRLWRNRGDGSFAQVLTGSLVNETGSDNQSGCWVDFNQDGNLDFFVATLNSGVDRLYMGNGNGNRWLEVKPKGTKSNRQAIGARIFATAPVRGKVMRQMRVITASDSDESLIAHFGLGDATKVTTLRIEWPSGAVQEIPNVAANQVLTVYEPPALAATVRQDGACELTIKAEPNRGWQIQASSDLLTWQTLTNVTSTSYQFQFTDPAAAGMDCRFYRLQVP